VELLLVAASHPAARGRVLHAGTGVQHSVRDMIETVLAVCGGGRLRAEYGAEPPRPDEPKAWVASLERTVALTGWRPRHDLRAGVARMWQWYAAAPPSAA
jgi:nucleoside-diphosphate-sugar epimerase